MADLIVLEGDQRVVIQNEEIGRTMTEGNNWNKIRIGATFCCSMDGSNTYLNAPPLVFGLCHGTTNMYHSDNCEHFIGLATYVNETDTQRCNWTNYTLSQSSTNGSVVFIGNSSNASWETAIRFVRKINNVREIDTGAILGSSYSAFELAKLNSGLTKSSPIFLEYIRNGNNIDWIFYGHYIGTIPFITSENFYLGMHNDVIPPDFYSWRKTGTIENVDEATYGALDTINIGWFSPVYDLYVGNIAYSIFE